MTTNMIKAVVPKGRPFHGLPRTSQSEVNYATRFLKKNAQLTSELIIIKNFVACYFI